MCCDTTLMSVDDDPLPREVLDAYLARHAAFETNMDVDGAMSTMSPGCWEEYLPLNYRMVNAQGVEALYLRVLKHAIPLMVGSDWLSISYGDSHVVTEKNVLIRYPSGREATMRRWPSSNSIANRQRHQRTFVLRQRGHRVDAARARRRLCQLRRRRKVLTGP